MKLSHLSETLIGSEIVKLGGEIREKMRQGHRIYNFTVGDFDPTIFPIPKELEDAIIDAYRNHFTNYPAAEGNLDLREAIASFTKEMEGLDYGPNEILVASGGRPLIYATFRAICDRGIRSFMQCLHGTTTTTPISLQVITWSSRRSWKIILCLRQMT